MAATDDEEGEVVGRRSGAGKIENRAEGGEERLASGRAAKGGGSGGKSMGLEFLVAGIAAFGDAVGVGEKHVAGMEGDGGGGELRGGKSAEHGAAGIERVERTIATEEQRRGQAGVAEDEFLGLKIETREEERGEGRLAGIAAEFGVDFGGDGGGIRMAKRGALQKADEMGVPEAGGEALAGNIADGESERRAEIENLEEVAGEMADGEDFAGNFEFAPDEFAGRAEAALNLSRFIDRLAKRGVLEAERVELLTEGERVLRSGERRESGSGGRSGAGSGGCVQGAGRLSEEVHSRGTYPTNL